MTNIEAHGSMEAVEYQFGPFSFVPARRALLYAGVRQRVGGRVLDILAVLLEHASEPVSKRELIARVWPTTVVEEGNLKVHVAALRRALGESGQGAQYISTVNGRGYCFIGAVEVKTRSTLVPPVGEACLPRPPGRVISRDATVEALTNMLMQRRLVSIVGQGGAGKSITALAVAEACASKCGMRVCFADLSALADPRLVPKAVAAVTGLGPDAAQTTCALADALRGACLLLVLDGCERVIDEAAILAGQIVAHAPGVMILCTSREPLRAAGEHVHRLAALAWPAAGWTGSAAEALGYPAVELFVARAAETVEHFMLTDADVDSVVDICRLLEGNALAIGLAATRIDAFGPRELAAQLADGLQLLERGHRSVQPRHRTLSDSFDWSYACLQQEEQKLVRAMSLFAGPFTIDAVFALWRDAGGNREELASRLADLVAKSILSSEPGPVATCYRMPRMTKVFARQKLEESGEEAYYCWHKGQTACTGFERAAQESNEQACDHLVLRYESRVDDLHSTLDGALLPYRDAAIGTRLTVCTTPLWTRLSVLEECRIRGQQQSRTWPPMDLSPVPMRSKCRPPTQLQPCLCTIP